MIGSTFTLKGKTYRNLEAQVLENQKRTIQNAEEMKTYDKTAWEAGEGREAIQQFGNRAQGDKAIATGYKTESGMYLQATASENVVITFQPREDGGYNFKFSIANSTTPITYIAPYRVYCSSYGNGWIGFSGPYDSELGFDVPDLTQADLINLEFDNYIDEYFIYNTRPLDEESQALGTTTEGYYTLAFGDHSHAEGGSTLAMGERSHAEGSYTQALGFGSHVEGVHTYTAPNALFAHAEGGLTKATAERSHAEGSETAAIGRASHSEGAATESVGNYSHAEGWDTHAYGSASHTEGRLTTANGDQSHAEGYNCSANGSFSHAEGQSCIAAAQASHVEGFSSETTSSAKFSHVEGYDCKAKGESSHVGGNGSEGSSQGSFLHGWQLRDSRWYQAVFGIYNEIPSPDKGEQFIVGCGNANQRANAFVAGNNSADGKYIKIGNTKLTEQALINLMDLIQPVVIDSTGLLVGNTITLPYTGNEMANHLNLTIHWLSRQGELIDILKIYSYYNDSDEVTIRFDSSSYASDGGTSIVLLGHTGLKTYEILELNEV